MKVYEVECLAVITIAEQDMEKAALLGAALIKDNPHLISVRAVHERNVEPAWEDPTLRTHNKIRWRQQYRPAPLSNCSVENGSLPLSVGEAIPGKAR
jgi:hypothetical protein